MIFNKKDKIQFISTVEGLESIDYLLPKPAKNFIPQWFKDIPSTQPSTVKICPSFPDFFSQGYIIPMWSDVKLALDGENWSWISPNEQHQWSSHSNNQFLDYTKASFNGVEAQFVFKAICPWRIITPPGWSVLQLPLFYHFNQEWSVLPGVIDTDIHTEINQQVLYHGNRKQIQINAGDPFVLYIPFKRSDKLKSVIRYQTEEDRKLFAKQNIAFKNLFSPDGWYRKMQRERDKNER
jgi:hypothetical protein